MASNTQSSFEDFLPIMAHKLGGDALIGELCNGFRLLMDGDKGVITFDSLKKNAAILGLQELTDGDLRSMLREGDFDGNGALNQMEFCVLMFRISTINRLTRCQHQRSLLWNFLVRGVGSW
ncbi:calcium-binding protein KRP1-like [Rhododendron vialii]|uniref:calcium-binding protein KRP1-like n=1 Tax=Rhododendron vialii TaxID=182163 RepID=UPI00265F0837|nr:calcium-binding protein KRP1-like [Rhododendron vialii]